MTMKVTAPVPAVGAMKAMRLPTVEERTIDNGLRIIVARRPGIPRFEARLVIPTVRNGKPADTATVKLLAKTLLSGTERRTSVELAEDLQRLGAGLDVAADAEDLTLYGSALSSELPEFLGLMAEVVTEASHPKDEVALQRDRLVQEIVMAKSQPATIAREAILGRLYGGHPYGGPLPDAEVVAELKRKDVKGQHGRRLRPEGSLLVLVGDLRIDRAMAIAEAAFAPWESGADPTPLKAPKFPAPGRPPLFIDRSGAVQTSIRFAGPAIGRTDPDYAALAVTNLVFGGYFISRLSDNLRERRGFTYGAGSGVQQYRTASHLSISTDVGTEHTAPALVEIDYELARLAATLPDDDELTSAKRYLTGTLSMGIQTQGGMAGYLATLAVFGLGIEYLREFPRQAEAVTAEHVRDTARRFFDRRRLEAVLVGDASTVKGDVEAVTDLE